MSDIETTGSDNLKNVFFRLKRFVIVDIMRRDLQLPRLYLSQSVGQFYLLLCAGVKLGSLL